MSEEEAQDQEKWKGLTHTGNPSNLSQNHLVVDCILLHHGNSIQNDESRIYRGMF